MADGSEARLVTTEGGLEPAGEGSGVVYPVSEPAAPGWKRGGVDHSTLPWGAMPA